jgi:dipeptidyl-peptidase-4
MAPVKRILAIAAALLTLAAPVAAQLPERLDRALTDIYARRVYTADTFGPVVWLDDGTGYAVQTATGIVRYETASGTVRTIATVDELRPVGAIAAFAFSTDATRLLLFSNTRKVWRLNTRGDYWVMDLRSRRLQQLGRGADASSLMFATFSPDGTRVAYVRQQNLYVEELATGRIAALTASRSAEVVNGTSDWVNEEELSIHDGFKWSPDGRQIAYLQFDTSGVGRFTLINDTDSLYPTLKQFPYPKAGTTNSGVRLGVVSAAGGATRWIAVPGDARDYYIPRFEWIGTATLALHHTARRQNADELLTADSRSGAVTRVYGEESKTWLDASDPLVMDPVRTALWFDDASRFTWTSDKDGWRHVYVVARQTGQAILSTRFDGDAMTLLAADRAGETLYFIASPTNATQRYLYAADVKTGAVRRITPASEPGTHSYDISPDARWAVHTYSRADVPPRVDLVSLPDHVVVRTLVTNDALAGKAAPYLKQPTEFTTVTIDGGVSIDTMVIKPADFDPSRRYPAVVSVYGEPADTLVDDRWATVRLTWQALANEGFVVLMFDNRGTPAPKGAAWRKVIYGSVGDLSSREQANAIKQFAATHQYVDASRIGIYGHSGGGTSTLNAMFRFPDVYRVGIASAPVADQQLYDTIYQERYMGLPQENPDGYRRGSPIGFADGLRGHLLLMHGTGDDNVHVQNTERLVNRLIELGKDFDLMLYPNRTHALSEGPGTTLHRWRTITRYLVTHLPSATSTESASADQRRR